MVGRTISHYHITEKLGGGGMGVVYKAHDTRLDRAVALKFLPSHLNTDPEANERFIREAKAASALDHPNICTIYDIGETEPAPAEAEGQLFIVMAYYAGQTLKYRLADGLTVDERVESAIQIAEGLARAHEAGIVHRDVKPANLMVTDRGRVKILDFGVAKLGGSAAFTQAGSTLGTVAYMSPEQTHGEEVDARTDLWALGVVMYEMLTGERPFRGDYDQAVVYSILNEDPEPITALSPEVPQALARVVEKLLAKDPAERYQRVEDLLPDLRAFRRADVQTGSVAAMEAAPEVPSMWRWVTIGIPVILLLLGGLWALSKVGSATDEPATPVARTAIAVLPFSVGGGDDLAYLEESMVDLLSLKLDGAGSLRGVDPNALLGFMGADPDAVRDPQRGQQVAAHFGAGHFILGTVTKLGAQIQFNATLYDDQAAVLTRAQADATDEDSLLVAIDDLARQLIAGQLGTPDNRQASIAALTTRSLPALKAFLEGEQAMRQAQWAPAIQAYERALAADSTFALAWYRLSVTIGWTDTPVVGIREAAEKALRYRDDLPERARTIIQARYAQVNGRVPEAERLYLSIIDQYPDYTEAALQLGELRFHHNRIYGRPRSEAHEPLERALAVDPDNREVLFHLIELAIQENRLEDSEALIARYAKNPTFEALQQFARGNEEEREQVLAALQEAGPVAIRGVIFRPWKDGMFDYQASGRLAEMLTASAHTPDDQALGHFWLLQLRFVAGQFSEGEARLTSLAERLGAESEGWALVYRAYPYTIPFYPYPLEALEAVRTEVARWDTLRAPLNDDWRYADKHAEIKAYLLGLLSYRLEDPAALQRYTEQLGAVAAQKGRHSLAHAFFRALGALLVWQQGDLEAVHAALDDVGVAKARSWDGGIFYGQWLHRYIRAEVLYQEGRYEEALRWYAALAYPHRGPSYLRRAEIYEHLGDIDNAILFYTRFLELWQDADAALQPQVAQARQRLDRLLGGTVREPNEVADPGEGS